MSNVPYACRVTPANIPVILSEASHLYDRSYVTYWIEQNKIGWFVRDKRRPEHECGLYIDDEFEKYYVVTQVFTPRLFKRLIRR